MWKRLKKLFAVLLGCISASILLAEATLLPSGVDLSIFSILINSVGTKEMLVQVVAFVPLLYMCICTYYSLFKIGMMTFYSLTPRHTSSVSLLMICSMVARYAPPVSFNFLNLISLDGKKKTIFEKRMGNIDNAVPFFGKGFNKLYPLIMVVYTLLVASGFLHRITNVNGIWRRITFQNEENDLDGLNPSGLIILKKERAWLEQGHEIGEEVVPLAKNFNDPSMDIESGKSKTSTGRDAVKMKPIKQSVAGRYSGSREAMSSKYAAIRVQQNIRQASNTNIDSAKVSLLGYSNKSWSGSTTASTSSSSSSLSSVWSSMRLGLDNLKANIRAKKYTPLLQFDEDSPDDFFHKLKQPYGDEDELD